MFATLLMLYRNYEKQAGLNTQRRLHQQARKDPVNRLMLAVLEEGSMLWLIFVEHYKFTIIYICYVMSCSQNVARAQK
jgi:hypothetical protein